MRGEVSIQTGEWNTTAMRLAVRGFIQLKQG